MQNEVEMVPETPPRRSKVEKEPVTIDLTAEESSTVAEPVRSNDSDEPETAAEKAAEARMDAAESAGAETTGDVAAPAVHAAENQPAEEPSREESLSGEQPAEEPKAETAREPEPAMAAAPEPVPAAPVRTSPATTTLAAAGIIGGIVALLLAGSMQYAGYLPGPAEKATVDTSSLSSEIAALRQQVQTLSSRPAAAAPDAALANRVAALEASAKTSGSNSGASDQALAALKGDLDRLRASVQSSAGNDANLTRRLDQAEAKLNDRGPEQQVARAVGAAALKAAIDRGGPFVTELQTFATVAGDDPAVAGLQDFANKGVPSRAELQRQFPAVADAMLEAVVQPDPNEGIAGRLLSSALSVVKVRRVGDVQGDAPEAIIARMEEALRNGNLQASADEWNALPDAAKTVSQAFKQRLDARIQVENLVGGTLTRAMAGTKG